MQTYCEQDVAGFQSLQEYPKPDKSGERRWRTEGFQSLQEYPKLIMRSLRHPGFIRFPILTGIS